MMRLRPIETGKTILQAALFLVAASLSDALALTALINAVRSDDAAVVKFLLESGADPYGRIDGDIARGTCGNRTLWQI